MLLLGLYSDGNSIVTETNLWDYAVLALLNAELIQWNQEDLYQPRVDLNVIIAGNSGHFQFFV
jgi:hypothetical protein